VSETRWEYTFGVLTETGMIQQLNEMGAAGWQAWALVEPPRRWFQKDRFFYAHFKRALTLPEGQKP